jgi:hypothetical protein
MTITSRRFCREGPFPLCLCLASYRQLPCWRYRGNGSGISIIACLYSIRRGLESAQPFMSYHHTAVQQPISHPIPTFSAPNHLHHLPSVVALRLGLQAAQPQHQPYTSSTPVSVSPIPFQADLGFLQKALLDPKPPKSCVSERSEGKERAKVLTSPVNFR